MEKEQNRRNKPHQKTALVILITFLLILVAGGIYYFSKLTNSGESSNSSSSAPSSTSSAKTSKLKVDTSNWVTYRNTAYGFELKYPPENWKVDVAKEEDPNTSPTPTFVHLCKYDVYCGGVGIYAVQDGYNPNYKLEDYFYILDLKEEVSRQKIKIGGEDALKVEFIRECPRCDHSEVFIYVLHAGKIYQIIPSYPSLVIKPEDLKPGDTIPYFDIQDAILASFKFID